MKFSLLYLANIRIPQEVISLLKVCHRR